jgi:AcrR family transcriptional regulator
MTARQKLCIAKLATGASVADVARELGISEKTIWSYYQEPTFRDAVDALTDTIIGDAAHQLTREFSESGPAAIAKIREIMSDKSATKDVQLRAAVALVDRLVKLVELRDLRRSSDGRKRR